MSSTLLTAGVADVSVLDYGCSYNALCSTIASTGTGTVTGSPTALVTLPCPTATGTSRVMSVRFIGATGTGSSTAGATKPSSTSSSGRVSMPVGAVALAGLVTLGTFGL
jgi:hypothetical protein